VPSVADVVAVLENAYPQRRAESWDAVGLVCGDPAEQVRRVLFVVDVVAATVDEALDVGAQLIVAHHPLLLRGVHGVPASTVKGLAVHRLIRGGVALFVAHTNADVADPGVSDALARRIGLADLRPLVPLPDEPTCGSGRIGRLARPVPLREFAELVAARLPATAAGVRAAGDPSRAVRSVAVCGGAGDSYLAAAAAAGVDAYVTADLRHHPASEHAEAGGPALVDVAHWASERPWLDDAAAVLRGAAPTDTVETLVSDLVTDPWALAVAAAPGQATTKETSSTP
jgi:dinuclear metal center YbgI/SA1388 family protein